MAVVAAVTYYLATWTSKEKVATSTMAFYQVTNRDQLQTIPTTLQQCVFVLRLCVWLSLCNIQLPWTTYRWLFLVGLSRRTIRCCGKTDCLAVLNSACWLMVVGAIFVAGIKVLLATGGKQKVDALVQRNVHSETRVMATYPLPGEGDGSLSIHFKSIRIGQVRLGVNTWKASVSCTHPPQLWQEHSYARSFTSASQPFVPPAYICTALTCHSRTTRPHQLHPQSVLNWAVNNHFRELILCPLK